MSLETAVAAFGQLAASMLAAYVATRVTLATLSADLNNLSESVKYLRDRCDRRHEGSHA